MENLANFNQGLAPIWTAEQIQKFKDGSDPNRYPNVDWWNKAIRKSAPQTQQNITIQGGNEKVKYFVSGGYFYQEAMPVANETKNKRYNLRSNIDIALTNKLKMNLDLSALYQDYFGPINEMERTSAHGGIMNDMFRSRPYYPFAFPDATKVPGGRQDPYYKSFSDVVGYKKWNRLNTDAKVSFSYDLPLGLKLKANFHINKENYSNKEKDKKTPTYSYNWDTDVYTLVGYTNTNQKIYNYSSNSTRFDQQYFLTWNKKIENHNISAMVVYELLSNDNEWIDASRTGYNVNIDYLFAGPILNLTNGGSASEGGRKGIISRFNYDYKGKYLIELNARNDASPKFPKETRWGFFPSASVGWRISEEEFIKKNLPILTNLKLRASYGKLGFDNTGNFQYMSTYAIASQYIFDGTNNVVSSGILADALANNQITWEKMTSKNIGLDFKLGSHFDGTFDYFYRLRTDVLGSRLQSVPNVVGAIMPQVNYAKYDNRGWEMALSYYNDIAGIHYSVGGNISRNREKSVFVDQAAFTNEEARRRDNKIGEWTDNFWGLKSDGLFQSKEEINGWADQDGKNNATILPGDIRYIDNNGDGKITDDDRIIIGRGIFPKLMFGVNMSLEWKGIDFSMLWQGAGDYDIDMRNAPDFTNVFYSGDSPMTQMLDAYTPPNPWLPTNTTNATFPLYRTDSYNRSHPNRTLASDYWLINGSYVRLKNIELGYTLPKGMTGKLGIERCKIYVAAYNLLTFSANKFMDPEMKTNTTAIGGYYPPVGTYNIGLSLEF
jgi:TonB-linked SusC/RagA family outer membrane protein